MPNMTKPITVKPPAGMMKTPSVPAVTVRAPHIDRGHLNVKHGVNHAMKLRHG